MKTTKNVLKAMVAAAIIAIAFIGLWVCPTSSVNAQGVGINPSGNNPDPSAMFDVSSTSKGTLITRMTTAQRNAIVSPAKGLQIYNTDCDNFNYNAGTPAAPNWMFANPSVTFPLATTTGTHTPSPTQIVWNWNTVSGATGYKRNTTNNYSGAMDNSSSTSYTQTGLTCNTAYTLFVWTYNACGNSSVAILTQSTSVCPFTCGSTLAITHTIGAVAPETKAVNYGTVTTSLSGSSKCWITQNLGATNQATSATDATDGAAGWYWRFNRTQGYKVGPTPAWTSYTAVDEPSGWLSANDPCTIELGAGWRIPTYTEWFNADASGQVGGWDDYNETYTDVLKLHTAGYLYNSLSALGGRGAAGNYWSSTQNSSVYGWKMFFYSGASNMTNDDKATGLSLRCLKD